MVTKGKAGTDYRGPVVRKAPGARLRWLSFCLSRLYHYTPVVKINHFKQRLSLSAIKSHSYRFGVKIFSLSALAEGAGWPKKIFYRGPDPFSAALDKYYIKYKQELTP